MEGHKLLGALRLKTGVDGYYDWQGGLLWLRMEAATEAEQLRAMIRHAGGGHATLVRASETERHEVPVFEPKPEPVAALEQRIREKYDRSGIFNPARMG
jgi:glycolate oxidase FAD binding subunit